MSIFTGNNTRVRPTADRPVRTAPGRNAPPAHPTPRAPDRDANRPAAKPAGAVSVAIRFSTDRDALDRAQPGILDAGSCEPVAVEFLIRHHPANTNDTERSNTTGGTLAVRITDGNRRITLTELPIEPAHIRATDGRLHIDTPGHLTATIDTTDQRCLFAATPWLDRLRLPGGVTDRPTLAD